MAIKITKVLRLGDGSTGYEFEVYPDPEKDNEVYQRGLKLELELTVRSYHEFDFGAV